jgi:hypothetical protein
MAFDSQANSQESSESSMFGSYLRYSQPNANELSSSPATFSEPHYGTIIPIPLNRQTGLAITRIEAILESIMDGLLSGATEISIPLQRIRRDDQLTPSEGSAIQEMPLVCFPGHSENEGKRFGRQH